MIAAGLGLVFIYVAPAVGKLTVGLELAARTGFKVLQNHLASLPAGRDLRAQLAAVHSRLLRELRVGMLDEAADAGIDLIAT